MPQAGLEEPGLGIVRSLRGLVGTVVALLQTRLELLVTELEEERMRLLRLLLWIAGAAFSLAVGIVLLVILVAALFWDTHRIAALAVLAGIFLAGGAAMAIAVRNLIRAHPRLFSASLEELAKDKEQLTP